MHQIVTYGLLWKRDIWEMAFSSGVTRAVWGTKGTIINITHIFCQYFSKFTIVPVIISDAVFDLFLFNFLLLFSSTPLASQFRLDLHVDVYHYFKRCWPLFWRCLIEKSITQLTFFSILVKTWTVCSYCAIHKPLLRNVHLIFTVDVCNAFLQLQRT